MLRKHNPRNFGHLCPKEEGYFVCFANKTASCCKCSSNSTHISIIVYKKPIKKLTQPKV